MATVLEKPEAVIISGPRKGEIVTLDGNAPQISPDEDAMFDAAIAAVKKLTQTIAETAEEAHALHGDITRWREGLT